jgi:hypothetical protein
MTPIKVKMTNCDITKKAKYRATTARSSRDCVKAPIYFDSHLIVIGRKNPKTAETAGGRTPDAIAKEPGEL